MCDMESIIVLVLPAFNFIYQRSHHSLTLTRSRHRDYATVTLTPGDGSTAIKVESSVLPISLFSRLAKSSDLYSRNNNGPKTLSCRTPDTTLINQFTPTRVHHNIIVYGIVVMIETLSISKTQNLQYPKNRVWHMPHGISPPHSAPRSSNAYSLL